MKLLKRVGHTGLAISLLFLLALNGCMSFRTKDKKVYDYFQEKAISVKIHRKQFENRTIRYLEASKDTNQHKKTALIFVHGAPGSSDNYHKYLADQTLLSEATLISIDRLGYGYSDYGKSEISIAKQAEQVKFVIDQYNMDKVILVGHSYGGPVVGKCAIDYPENLAAIVMLAPVNDPYNEKIFWFSHFARWKLTKWLLPKSLKVAGDEKFSHKAELAKMSKQWSSIRLPVVHIHGRKDKIAPPINLDFSINNIDSNYLRVIDLEDTNHFIPWSDYGLVKKVLLELLTTE